MYHRCNQYTVNNKTNKKGHFHNVWFMFLLHLKNATADTDIYMALAVSASFQALTAWSLA